MKRGIHHPRDVVPQDGGGGSTSSNAADKISNAGALVPTDEASLKKFRDTIGTALRVMVGSRLPDSSEVEATPVGEKVRLLRAYGAEIVITPTSVPPDSPESYNGVADRQEGAAQLVRRWSRRPRQQADITSFANLWLKNIAEQQDVR